VSSLFKRNAELTQWALYINHYSEVLVTLSQGDEVDLPYAEGRSCDESRRPGRYLRRHSLKVPKCEIFDRSDFHDFYPIKSLWESDFGVKIKCF
jgi:hypothetical protein